MTYTTLSTDKARIDHVREMLRTSDQWILRALVAIFHRQTADEQNQQMTKYWNAVGFTGADGEILTSFAQQVLRKGYDAFQAQKIAYPISFYLSAKQEAILRRRITKYARQLVKISKGAA